MEKLITITIRMPIWLISDLESIAKKKNMTFQLLVTTYLEEKIKEEQGICASRYTLLASR